MRYKDMTPAERRAAYDNYSEGLEVHIQCFAVRPPRDTRLDRQAMNHADHCQREMQFIERVARSLGDEWAKR